ncbi:putative bifunctional diguanylate cyclase/phosphodiesterase [Microvirga roseola]|uniref:putative bifunctional diguanylate cyclase/phosphodiesterase n=1 Tax=Microvirga roseola TaxID=2883126 RepID=UPI001E65BCC7|nr:EAL domain-containing protein [Microvirga roseola]
MRIPGHAWLTQFFNRRSQSKDAPIELSAAGPTEGIGAPNAPDDQRLSQYARAFLEGTTDCVFFLDRRWCFTFLNRRALHELEGGFDLVGRNIWDVFPQALGTPFEIHYRRALAENTTQIFEAFFPPLSSWYEVHAVPVGPGLTVFFRNIDERRAAADTLRERERQLAIVFGQTMVGILHRDLNRQVLMVNQRFCEIVGRSRDELNGLPMEAFTHADDIVENKALFEKHLANGEPFQIEKRYVRPDGTVVWCAVNVSFVQDDWGQVVSTILVVEDIGLRKVAEERLLWNARHDLLTQLPNRMLFQERLTEALKCSASTGLKVGLLLLDLDHLKQVNDTLGHDAGDCLLRTAAERLRSSIRPIDTVARNGGDEFAVVMPDIGSEEELEEIVRPLLARLQEPFLYAGHTVSCSASIGVSIWPDHTDQAEELHKQADIALYMAKAGGRGKIMIFEPSMRAETHRRAQMRNNAREAIESSRIEPYYQPKVHLASGKLAGFEALLRWHDPQDGLQPPSAIQAAFDDPRLAVAIGQQIQELVLGDMRRWLDAGVDFGHVAINASAAEFRGHDFADQLLERLRAARIPSRYLELEVTETVFLGQGAEHVESALRMLSAEGIRIALDDFGTGYASLSHLKQFPVDIIKIDRSFVRDLAENPDDTAILQAVLSLGQNLGIATVAEGVETEVQVAFLRAQGCDLGQGYLFGKAAPKDRISELIASWDVFRHRSQTRSSIALL